MRAWLSSRVFRSDELDATEAVAVDARRVPELADEVDVAPRVGLPCPGRTRRRDGLLRRNALGEDGGGSGQRLTVDGLASEVSTLGCDLVTALLARDFLSKKENEGATIVFDLRSSHSGTGRFFSRKNCGLNSFD